MSKGANRTKTTAAARALVSNTKHQHDERTPKATHATATPMQQQHLMLSRVASKELVQRSQVKRAVPSFHG